ncbi:MAG: beta-galactosidase [Chloroflexi bacterium]|nr:beta-galactosidase [Chloroflexota bacterium]MCL5274750.1 beta-galactosidase [Chloroflexota bacterium]
MRTHQVISFVLRGAALLWLLTLIRPPQVLVTLGAQQTVVTRNDLAGVHTRFIDEAEAWKIQRGLSMVREMGAAWIVEFFPWAYLEPAKGQYQWGVADRIIQHANRQGLRVIARLGFAPGWARPDPHTQATIFTYLDRAHYGDFADFAAAFAAHYRGQIDAIVIWNEPNLTSEWGMQPVDPAGYVEMLNAVYPPIKRANPDVVVLAGALAPTLEPPGSAQGLNDLDYLAAMYRTIDPHNRPYDGWAMHSYGRTLPPEDPPARGVINYRRSELLHDIMAEHGDGNLPVYITEAGWNDDANWVFAVTPAQRIQYTLRAWEYAKANWPWVRSVDIWVFKLPSPAHGYRDHYTFVTPSLEPLPIYEEVKSALNP